MKSAALGCILAATIAGPARAAAAAEFACPAAAAPADPTGGNGIRLDYDWEIDGVWRGTAGSPYIRASLVNRRINRGLADGSLSRDTARQSRDQLADIRRVSTRMAERLQTRGCRPSASDRRLLQHRFDIIDRQLDGAARNGG